MKKELNRTRKCPKCGAEYQGHPAISRRDNKQREEKELEELYNEVNKEIQLSSQE